MVFFFFFCSQVGWVGPKIDPWLEAYSNIWSEPDLSFHSTYLRPFKSSQVSRPISPKAQPQVIGSQTHFNHHNLLILYLCVCVCVCVRERERERENTTHSNRHCKSTPKIATINTKKFESNLRWRGISIWWKDGFSFLKPNI